MLKVLKVYCKGSNFFVEECELRTVERNHCQSHRMASQVVRDWGE